MTKDVGILILGLLTAAMPYLGFPTNYENMIFVVMGLSIALLAFLIRGDLSLFTIERTGDTFTDSSKHEKPLVGDGISAEGTEMNHDESKGEHT